MEDQEDNIIIQCGVARGYTKQREYLRECEIALEIFNQRFVFASSGNYKNVIVDELKEFGDTWENYYDKCKIEYDRNLGVIYLTLTNEMHEALNKLKWLMTQNGISIALSRDGWIPKELGIALEDQDGPKYTIPTIVDEIRSKREIWFTITEIKSYTLEYCNEFLSIIYRNYRETQRQVEEAKNVLKEMERDLYNN